jgi:multidrug efflux pump subunit AcrA (membrane-fusion protein)
MKFRLRTIFIPLGILLFGFILMRILLGFREEPQKRKPVIRPKIVDAAIVHLKPVPSQIIGYGRLSSAQPVLVFSEVPGILERGDVPFQPAQSFNKGDLVLKIDDRQIRLDLNSSKSDFLNALASVLPEIKVDFPDEFPTWQDYFNLCELDKKLPPLPDAANNKIKLFLSRFNVYKLYFQVSDFEIRLEKHFFYAPFNGSIVSTDLRVGSNARAGTRLGEIINLDDLEVEVPVPVQDIQWIDRSKPVKFTSSEISGEWTGKITRIGRNIDERTQSVQVFMKVDRSASTNLYNGIFLKSQIPGKLISNGFRVSPNALYNQENVYLIKNGRLDYREVSVARKETETIIINGGVQNGDTIVVELMQGVVGGMPVEMRDNELREGQK